MDDSKSTNWKVTNMPYFHPLEMKNNETMYKSQTVIDLFFSFIQLEICNK